MRSEPPLSRSLARKEEKSLPMWKKGMEDLGWAWGARHTAIVWLEAPSLAEPTALLLI